jgi:hypothetical protein
MPEPRREEARVVIYECPAHGIRFDAAPYSLCQWPDPNGNGNCALSLTAREYVPASLADRYRETLEWIARVRDTPEWRTVTLTQIVDRANRALGDNHG